MSGHTEGPWYILNSDGCGGEICVTSWGYKIHGADFCVSGNAEADARLIAAAPDLLEALQILVERYEDQVRSEYEGTRFLEPLLEPLLECTESAKAAIAKAAGGDV